MNKIIKIFAIYLFACVLLFGCEARVQFDSRNSGSNGLRDGDMVTTQINGRKGQIINHYTKDSEILYKVRFPAANESQNFEEIDMRDFELKKADANEK